MQRDLVPRAFTTKQIPDIPLHLIPKTIADLIKGKPEINMQKNSEGSYHVCATHPFIGKYYFYFEQAEQLLFTENETNNEKIFRIANETPLQLALDGSTPP